MIKKISAILLLFLMFFIPCNYRVNALQENKYTYDFENGPDIWEPSGDVRLIKTEQHVKSGNCSIYIDHRTSSTDGIRLSVDFLDKQTENIYTAYVMYTNDQKGDSRNFFLNIHYNTPKGQRVKLIDIVSVPIKKWTKLSGTFELPIDATKAYITIQTSDTSADISQEDSTEFYIDLVSIEKATVVAQRNSKTKSNIALVVVIVVACIALVVAIVVRAGKKLMNESVDKKTQTLNAETLKAKINVLKQNTDMCKNLYISTCSLNFLDIPEDSKEKAMQKCVSVILKATGKDALVYKTDKDEFVCMSKVSIQDKLQKAISEEKQNKKEYPFYIFCGFSHCGENDKPDIIKLLSKAFDEMHHNMNIFETSENNPDF